MAVDVAALALRVDAQGFTSAEAALGRFEGTAHRAEGAATKLEGGVNKASKSFTHFRTNILGYVATASAALAAIGSTTKQADRFHDSLAEVSTLVDTTTFNMGALADAALNAGNAYGSTQAQTKAFYSIISAGAATVGEANDTLIAANKLAVGGVTDLETAADGLTSVLNAYGDEVESATAVSDAMFVGMKAGKTTIGELSHAVGSVAPLAKQAGVSFDELVASTAALTKTGQTTSVSMNGVRAIIASIIKPSAEASKESERLGLAFDAQALKTKGLAGFMQDLKEKTGGNTEVMAKLFGGVEALTPVLALTGASAKDFGDILEQMGDKAGETEKAFAKMENSPAFQKKRLFGAITVQAIKLGDTLSTALVPAMRFLADHMADLVAVAQVVAVLFAVKLAIGMAAYVVSTAKAGIETTKYNIKLARMAGLSRRAAVSQTLLGAATSKVTAGFNAIGGKLGLVAIAVTGLSIAYRANKDEIVTLGETTASVSEWMGATWEWVGAMASQAADVIGYVFSDSFKQVEDPSPWDTLVGYFHELPKNAKIVTNEVIGFFVGSIVAIQTVWGNLPAYFASIMLSVEIAVKRKVAGLLKALIKPINSVRSLANLPPIHIPIKVDIPTAALKTAKADITSVGKAFKTAFKVDYVGAFGKAFTKGVVKPISKFIKKKPHKSFDKLGKSTRALAVQDKKLAAEAKAAADAAKKLAGETKGSDKATQAHVKSTKKSTSAKKKNKAATIKLTQAEKAAAQVRKSALADLSKLVKENAALARELAGLPAKVKGLTEAENKQRNALLKSIEAKKKDLEKIKAYKSAIKGQKDSIAQMNAELRLSAGALRDYNLQKKYGTKADIEAIKANDAIIEQLQRQQDMYAQLEGAVGSYVDKLLGGFKGVGHTVKNLKRALTDMVSGKGSAGAVGNAALNVVSPHKGSGAGAAVGNASNVYRLAGALGADKWTKRLASAGSFIGTAMGGQIGGAIGSAIGALVGMVRNWLHKKAKIRFDQSVDRAAGEQVYEKDSKLARTTTFGTFGVSDATSKLGRASKGVQEGIQTMLDAAVNADKLMASILDTRSIAHAAEVLRSQKIGYGNNKADAEAFLNKRLSIQIREMDGALRALIPSTATYTEKLKKLQEIQLAQKKYLPVMRQMGIASNFSNAALTALSLSLAETSGGFQNFTSLMDNYNNKLLSSGERTAFTTRALATRIVQFQQDVGDSSITSSEGLKAYIENIKNSAEIATAAGREHLISALNAVDAYAQLEALEAQRVETLNTLRIAGLGANEGLIEVAGGLGALSSLVDNYTSTVYSAEEQSLIKQAEAANQIRKIAEQLGIDPNTISTTEGLRAAVDALSAGNTELTQAQQEQLVALLESADAVRLLSEAGLNTTEALAALPDNLKGVVGGFNEVLPPLEQVNAELTSASATLQTIADTLNGINVGDTGDNGNATNDSNNTAGTGNNTADNGTQTDGTADTDAVTNETANNNTNSTNETAVANNASLIQAFTTQSTARNAILNSIRDKNEALVTRMQALEAINKQLLSTATKQLSELEMQRELKA